MGIGFEFNGKNVLVKDKWGTPITFVEVGDNDNGWFKIKYVKPWYIWTILQHQMDHLILDNIETDKLEKEIECASHIRINRKTLDFLLPSGAIFNTRFGYYDPKSNLAKWILLYNEPIRPHFVTTSRLHAMAQTVYHINYRIPHQEYLDKMKKRIGELEKENFPYINYDSFYEEMRHWKHAGRLDAYQDVSTVWIVTMPDKNSYLYIWHNQTIRDVPDPYKVYGELLNVKVIKEGLFKKKSYAILNEEKHELNRISEYLWSFNLDNKTYEIIVET